MIRLSHKNAALLFATLSAFSTASFAGTATITGHGQVTAMPEFVSVTVLVKSECYASAVTASKANDEIATKVLGILRQSADAGGTNEITATGGFVERYNGYDTRTNRPICSGKFRKTNQLTLKTFALQSFTQTFATLEDGIYKLGMESSPSGDEAPNSFLEINTPVTGLSPGLTKKLERRALVQAFQDAKDKFTLTLEMAGIKTYSIVGFSDTEHRLRPITSERSAHFSAPIQFGSLMIESSLTVQFEYTGGSVVIP